MKQYNLDYEVSKIPCRKIDSDFTDQGERRIRTVLSDTLSRAASDGTHIHFDYNLSRLADLDLRKN
ncbi:MAG: hypothetical protein KKF56_00490 [Nanoarchaeota archaeon]|nr:hypothetical protein [Nanoarchaeota archaeon]